LKSSKVIYYILGLVIVIVVIMIAKESFIQPGLERFEGKYKTLGTYRNENNTGPVIRLFAVKSLDSDYLWMEEYGNSLPHTKYGRTIVFFFSDNLDQEVKLSPKAPHYKQSLQPFLIASYEKTPMGEIRFTKVKGE
jgi:hypothetical protein